MAGEGELSLEMAEEAGGTVEGEEAEGTEGEEEAEGDGGMGRLCGTRETINQRQGSGTMEEARELTSGGRGMGGGGGEVVLLK